MTAGRRSWRRSLQKAWRLLPWDGEGWAPSPDADLAEPRRRSGAEFRRRAGAFRLGLWIASRIGWAAAAFVRSAAFARRRGLSPSSRATLFADCLQSGATPVEAHVWRGLHGGRHPLPSRAAGLLLAPLGDPAGRALLADKLATSERLAAIGVAVPKLLGVVDGPNSLGEKGPPWREAGDLFVKPRHGSAGRSAFALVRRGAAWGWAQGDPPPWTQLRRRLVELSVADALLVQELLAVHPDLADLAEAGRPPVLRMTTLRSPGQAPLLHGAVVEIPVPGRSQRDFLQGALRAPIDLGTGRMASGVLFARPGERFARLPWNSARLDGRVVPGFGEAAAAVVAAMAAIPPVPLVGWDVVPTPAGPVVLEGNTAGNWIVTTLAESLGFGMGPPPSRVVAEWSARAQAARD